MGNQPSEDATTAVIAVTAVIAITAVTAVTAFAATDCHRHRRCHCHRLLPSLSLPVYNALIHTLSFYDDRLHCVSQG